MLDVEDENAKTTEMAERINCVERTPQPKVKWTLKAYRIS
jgi:hypothetical protein